MDKQTELAMDYHYEKIKKTYNKEEDFNASVRSFYKGLSKLMREQRARRERSTSTITLRAERDAKKRG